MFRSSIAAASRFPPKSLGTIRCRSPLLSRPCPENGGGPRAEYFRGEWYYPGDIGMLDADGYLYLRGRVADIIRRAGHEVFAPDVEAAIVRHLLVAELRWSAFRRLRSARR